MRIVIALGGNALLARGEPLTLENQRRNVERAVSALVPLVGAHQLVLTHGNGPQVGLLALQRSGDPLDVLDAETEGQIGYLLEQELSNALPGQPCATLLTQIEVDAGDPAFHAPTKPIGPHYDADAATRLQDEHRWSMVRTGDHWRRVVASPRPQRILELDIIRMLVEQGVTVICAGGGGIPVVRRDDGRLHGVDAVIDKDSTSSLLARQLQADALLLLTDVDAVYASWQTPDARAIHQATPAELRALSLEPGSMAPKVTAACEFVEATGRLAGIGRLQDAGAILQGDTGTMVTR